MRVLLFFIMACCMWPALAGNDLADCAEIESAVERLDCYDRLAREASREKPSEGEESADTERGKAVSTPPSEPERARAPAVKSAPSDQAGNKTVDRDIDNVELFGKEHQQEPVVKVDHIDARIESVRTTPMGQHIMTLSNGQVWMENEPGRRSIEANQDVTIRKHRWHYELELKSQPNVAVKRVD